MENKQIITLAYELARTKYKNKSFTFEQLWADLIKKAKLDKEEQKIVGHVYTCMLQDHRFIFIGNREWKVREFLKTEEQSLLSHALFDFKQEQEAEEKRIADLNDRQLFEEQEAFYDEEDLEEMHREYKAKLMHSVDDEDEASDIDNEVHSEENEEDVE